MKPKLDRITLVKNLKFDNSQCKRKIPYEGESWFALYNKDVKRYKETLEYYLEAHNSLIKISDFIFVKGSDIKISSIKALDHQLINDYVLGITDVLPQQIDFEPKLHTTQWANHLLLSQGFSIYELKSYNIPYVIPVHKYQVLTK